MKKIGLLGLGNKTGSTLQQLKKSKIFNIIGIYDNNLKRLQKLSAEAKISFTNNAFGLIAESDLLIIAKTDDKSFNLIVESIINSKHVVIDNPYLITIKELEELKKLATEASVSIIPFLPWRFNNCLLNSKPYIINPKYINIVYTSTPVYGIIAEDISEKLLYNIDVATNLVKGKVNKINVAYVKVSGIIPQVINIRLEFDNGCTVCMFFDFISVRNEFTVSVYQTGHIVQIDLLRNNAKIKTFDKKDYLKFEISKLEHSGSSNPYDGIINYLNTFEVYSTPINLVESFADSLSILKKVEDKLTF